MPNTGFIDNPFDERDVWEDEILGGVDTKDIPESYRIEGLRYQPQGSYPFCVSFAVTTMAEHWYKNEFSFSQPHLFFHSNGGKNGSSFRANLDTAREYGMVSESLAPMPERITGKPSDWLEALGGKYKAIPFSDAKKIGGYVRIKSDAESIKRAILQHGPLLVGVHAGSGDYYTGNGVRVKDTDNHAILLVGWTKTHWVIFDSLFWVKKNSGYGTLSISYTFPSAYAMTSLPENWKQLRDEKRSNGWENVLNHYGKEGDHEKEVSTANELARLIAKNKDAQSVAGKFWLVYVNAIVYGGYTFTDIINDAYNFATKGVHIFNFNNQTRSDWEYARKTTSMG